LTGKKRKRKTGGVDLRGAEVAAAWQRPGGGCGDGEEVLDGGDSVVLAGGARTVSDGRGVVDEVRRAVAVREVAAALGGAP
jgi:8-oxo-dGTP pyrophosphatase MutT (NUDIX family)